MEQICLCSRSSGASARNGGSCRLMSSKRLRRREPLVAGHGNELGVLLRTPRAAIAPERAGVVLLGYAQDRCCDRLFWLLPDVQARWSRAVTPFEGGTPGGALVGLTGPHPAGFERKDVRHVQATAVDRAGARAAPRRGSQAAAASGRAAAQLGVESLRSALERFQGDLHDVGLRALEHRRELAEVGRGSG